MIVVYYHQVRQSSRPKKTGEKMITQPLTNEQLQRLTPSVFALEPWQEQSEKYRFIPTINVINALRDSGFYPVRAQQSQSRIPGKAEFTKHMLRFRLAGKDVQVNDIIPEIGLINSHDGTSSYQIFLGLFRVWCSNGAVVADSEIETIRVRHTGALDLCQQVIDVSGKVIEESPKVLETVNRWRSLLLTRQEQTAFAEASKELNDSTIDVDTDRLLLPRHNEDVANPDGRRDLWRTYNVIQENTIKGGRWGRDLKGRRVHTRAIKSVDKDLKINKALWTLTAKMAELKTQ
jgi:hypothetical protein